MGTIKCTVDKPFIFNRSYKVGRGKEFWRDNEICFPGPDLDVDGNYRTIYSGVCDESVIFRNCNDNFRLAMRRLTCVLQPDQPGLHELLVHNQEVFVKDHEEYYSDMKAKYQPFFHEYGDPIEQAYDHYQDPHPKKELRIAAFKELHEQGLISNPNSLWTRKTAWWKMKPNEYAKPNKAKKYPRSIVDIGVGGSLLGFRFFELFKRAQAAIPLELNGGYGIFVKSPDPWAMKEAFELLRLCKYRFVYVYFSDDSCIAINVDGKVYKANLDISTSDASQHEAMFNMFQLLTPDRLRYVAEKLTEQCRMPLKIRDLNNPKNKITLINCLIALLSGFTGTTCFNNFAQLNIFISIAESSIHNTQDILDAAKRAGYVITLQEVIEHEDFQFLKHSPIKNIDGEYIPMLNPGVLFRAAGKCNGDLPGRGDLKERADKFQRGLLKGAYPRIICGFLTSMWNAVGWGPFEPIAMEVFKYKVVVDETFPVQHLDDDSIRRRYKITRYEYDQMCYLLQHYSYGYSLNCSAFESILQVDYGVGLTTSTNHSYFFNRHTYS